MKQLDEVTIGDRPQAVTIRQDGKLALIANRVSKDVNVISIDGRNVKMIGTVPIGDAGVAAAITPDGKRAFVVKNTTGRVAVLTLDGDKVTCRRLHRQAATHHQGGTERVDPDRYDGVARPSGIDTRTGVLII